MHYILFTFEPANQKARKVLFISVVYNTVSHFDLEIKFLRSPGREFLKQIDLRPLLFVQQREKLERTCHTSE